MHSVARWRINNEFESEVRERKVSTYAQDVYVTHLKSEKEKMDFRIISASFKYENTGENKNCGHSTEYLRHSYCLIESMHI